MPSKRKKNKNPVLAPVRRGAPAKAAPQPEKTGKALPPWLWPAAVLVLVATGGILNGWQSNRWVDDPRLEEAANRVKNVRMAFDDWVGSDLPLDPDQVRSAGAEAILYRVYTNTATQKRVQVMLLCGPFGPVAVHPPTVCFVGAGWQLGAEPKVESLPLKGGGQGDFWYAPFGRESATEGVMMHTFWGWHGPSGVWQAPTNPRGVFAGEPFLYKLYVSEVVDEGSIAADEAANPAEASGVAMDFLSRFTNELHHMSGIQ